MLTERTTTLFVSIFYFQKCQTREYKTFPRRLQSYFVKNITKYAIIPE